MSARPVLPPLAAAAAVAASGATLQWCMSLAFAYAADFSLSCGTPAGRVMQQLTEEVPLALLVPLCAAHLARGSAIPYRVARCAATGAFAGYFAVLLCIWVH
jgi:hypothetical protein